MLYTISITGNWCDGYYWQIINKETGRCLEESGPYHRNPSERFSLSNPKAERTYFGH